VNIFVNKLNNSNITRQIVSYHIFQLLHSVVERYYLKKMDISQGSVATHLRWGGIYNNDFIVDVLVSVSVKTSQRLAGYVQQ